MEVHRLLDEYFTNQLQVLDDPASPISQVNCCNLVGEDDDKVELFPSAEGDTLPLSQHAGGDLLWDQYESRAIGMSQPVNIANDLETLKEIKEKLNIKVYRQFQVKVMLNKNSLAVKKWKANQKPQWL